MGYTRACTKSTPKRGLSTSVVCGYHSGTLNFETTTTSCTRRYPRAAIGFEFASNHGSKDPELSSSVIIIILIILISPREKRCSFQRSDKESQTYRLPLAEKLRLRACNERAPAGKRSTVNKRDSPLRHLVPVHVHGSFTTWSIPVSNVQTRSK